LQALLFASLVLAWVFPLPPSVDDNEVAAQSTNNQNSAHFLGGSVPMEKACVLKFQGAANRMRCDSDSCSDVLDGTILDQILAKN
jgi:hypothetical protein